MPSKRVTRDIILVLIILSVAIIVPVAYLAAQARRDISEQFIRGAAGQASARFRSMTLSIETTLGLMRDWGAGGQLQLIDDEELARLLFPVFGKEPLLSGISVADIDGGSFYLRRDGAGFHSRRVTRAEEQDNAEEKRWSADAEVLERTVSTSSYDPRTRPWFAPALVSADASWTAPYEFFSVPQVGVTASTSFLRQEDDRRIVVAFDLLLDQPFEGFFKLAPSKNSRVIILRHDNMLYLPGSEETAPGFAPMAGVEDALLRKVLAGWAGKDRLADRVIPVLHEGVVWWSGFQPLEPENPTTWICVMVPELDIVGQAGGRMARVIAVGLVSLLVAGGLVFWIARRHRRAFEETALFDPENAEADIRHLIERGENRAVEFKSTMRMNLHTKKTGREIELAWIKGVAGFLNTDGGVLLLGVTDDGEITGLERDVFENEDKCRLHFKNLISKHIGAELSKYIRFHVVPMAGKSVGVVCCARAEEPVFVKEGNKEHFYIRNGPSSDELPVSQALSYINHRKK